MFPCIRLVRVGVYALSACLLIVGIACGQEQNSELYGDQVHDLAGRLLKRAEKAKCRVGSCTILVANFTMPSGSTSRLGMQLADSIASELVAQGPGIQVVDRRRLQDYLVREHIPSVALKGREAARWLATEFHANAALVGTIEDFGSKYNFLTELLSVSSDKIGPQEAFTIAIPQPEKALAPFEPYDADRPTPRLSAGVTSPSYRGGINGVGIPECIHCPPPQYSNAARKVKFMGTVVLEVTVTEDGRATDVRVLKGIPFGLSGQAIRAVNGWTFKPASSGGKPVAVRVPIEVTFRIY